MDSRELANHLHEVANFLDARPVFRSLQITSITENYSTKEIRTTLNFYDKEAFTTAAKSIGNAKKHVEEGEYARFSLMSKLAPVDLSIQRDKVCQKTIKYECEPLFSVDELEKLGD